MKALLQGFFTLGLIVFVAWALISGAGSLLILFGAYAYLFIMKHGR